MRIRFREPLTAFSERARKAFQLANQEAQRLNHTAVGTEHLLLGLAKDNLTSGGAALRRLGFNLPWLRRQVELLHIPGDAGTVSPGALPYTNELEEFIADTMGATENCAVLPLTPEMLLLALVNQKVGSVNRIFGRRRVRLWFLRRRLRKLV